jgi:rhamnulokinase
MKVFLAIDIGASSGRHILGWIENNLLKIEEIYRFDNYYNEHENHFYWDIEYLYDQIIEGLKECKHLNKIPTSMGIDTWGVDYVLLDKHHQRVSNPYAYRDHRTTGVAEKLWKQISYEELYQKTGIQRQPFNSIVQLLAHQVHNPNEIIDAETFLLIPDYLHYRLTGVISNEYTNSTTTQLIDVSGCTWDISLLKLLDIKSSCFGDISEPGTMIGKLKDELALDVGFQTVITLPPTHDTASAIVATPLTNDRSVYISSGTWSLMGVELDKPIVSDDARKLNFTNEGGYQHRYRFLKNIMGLWLIQCIKAEYNHQYDYPQLAQFASQSSCETIIDCFDERLLSPVSMIETIKLIASETHQQIPESIQDQCKVVYQSLAHSYANTLNEIRRITNRDYDSIIIVGGGAYVDYLNQLTADITGLEVHCGPIEATAIGNLVTQMISHSEINDLSHARTMIRESFNIKTFTPRGKL